MQEAERLQDPASEDGPQGPAARMWIPSMTSSALTALSSHNKMRSSRPTKGRLDADVMVCCSRAMVAHPHPAALLLIRQPAVELVAFISAWHVQGRGSYAAAVASPRVSGEVSTGAMRPSYMMAGVQGQVQHSTPRYFGRQPKAAPQSGVAAQVQGRQPLVPNLRLPQPQQQAPGHQPLQPPLSARSWQRTSSSGTQQWQPLHQQQGAASLRQGSMVVRPAPAGHVQNLPQQPVHPQQQLVSAPQMAPQTQRSPPLVSQQSITSSRQAGCGLLELCFEACCKCLVGSSVAAVRPVQNRGPDRTWVFPAVHGVVQALRGLVLLCGGVSQQSIAW